MLPNIDTDDGDVRRQEGILVGRRHDLKSLKLDVITLHSSRQTKIVLLSSQPRMEKKKETHKPAPTGTLDGQCRGVELFLKRRDRAKRCIDSVL